MTDSSRSRELEQKLRNGLIALESGQYDYAVSIFREILEKDPESARAMDGIRLAKARKLQKAKIITQKLRKPLYIMQAGIYRKLGRRDRAMDKYESLFAMVNPPYRLLAHLADIYYEKSMVESAVGAYKTVLQEDLNNVHCLRKLGKIYIDKGEMAEAKKVYDHLASIAPSDEAVMKEVKDAYALFTIDRGRWDEDASFRLKIKKEEAYQERAGEAGEDEKPGRPASGRINFLRKQAEEDPSNITLRKELADNLSEMRRFEEAISHYRKILELEPENRDALVKIYNLCMNEGDFPSALKAAEKLHALLPDNPGVLIRLARLYEKQDAPLKAIEAYTKLVSIEPENAQVREELGKLYEQNRYFDRAIEEYEKVLAMDPLRTDLQESIGSLYLREGKVEKAIEKFEKAASSDPGNIPLRKLLAGQYISSGMLEQAAGLCREILKTAPGDESAEAMLAEAETLMKKRRLEEAEAEIKKLEDILRADPENAGAAEKLDAAANAKLDIKISLLEDSLRSRPAGAELRFELGSAYRLKGDTDKAIGELQQAASDPVFAARALHLLGLCFEDKKMLDIARRQVEKAEAACGGTPELKKPVLYDLGRIYEKSGEKEKALEKYKEIYEIDIHYRDVAEKIEDAYK